MLEILKVIEILDSAQRIGSDQDDPEGNRYIQISDILARQMADQLRQALSELMRIVKIDLRPGDKIILKSKDYLSEEARKSVETFAKSNFSGHQIIVLQDGMDIEIVGNDLR